MKTVLISFSAMKLLCTSRLCFQMRSSLLPSILVFPKDKEKRAFAWVRWSRLLWCSILTKMPHRSARSWNSAKAQPGNVALTLSQTQLGFGRYIFDSQNYYCIKRSLFERNRLWEDSNLRDDSSELQSFKARTLPTEMKDVWRHEGNILSRFVTLF